jgi:putative pyruvate formate lyase activating enzyme
LTSMREDPAYLQISLAELQQRAEDAHQRMESCDLCAHACGANRLGGELGTCKSGARARVSSFGAHHGEEDPLRGWNGSGTIFFARCNLHCQFCQNHDISQADAGYEATPGELAEIMLHLQAAGCHNINLVSPSHVVAPILEGLVLAARAGLHLPLVYNTGGYDALETLEILDGVVDIYMPDMKYASPENAEKFSRIKEYPRINRAAVGEMHRQVGDLQLDENGIATRGLLVRHLILPNGLAGTREIVDFLAQEISPNTYLNLMDQYRPVYRADHFPELNRGIARQEYDAAVRMAVQAGIKRLDERRGGLFL